MLFSAFMRRARRVPDVERVRIAKVLHDDVGQVLSAVGLQLELLRMDFEIRAPEICVRTTGIQELLDSAMARLRELINGLGAE
jgi:signal transduction histidine kinase